MPDELVHYEVADRIATITLDSPHNRNALSRQLVTELFDRLDRADQDADVLAVVLQSSGRVFCSGADLTEASTTSMEEGARAIVSLQRTIVGLSKPVVTVVVDTPERTRRWFEVVDELTDETGLVTSELVPAFRATGPDLERGGLRLSERIA